MTALSEVQKKIDAGARLSVEDGLGLFRSRDVLAIGELAQSFRTRLHGKHVYYSVNLHLNHTNICPVRCEFCAFSRDKNDAEAYSLSADEICKRVGEAVQKWNINELHMVGGHDPEFDLEHYAGLFQKIKKKFPEVHIKALSAPEIDDLSKRSGLPVAGVLQALKEAGLDSLPGGGAEIFEPEVRRKICPKKITGAEWLEVHRTAHKLGFSTNATMLYGHIESDADRVNHLLALRELQDETAGFQSFIPLPYNPGTYSNTLSTPGVKHGGSGGKHRVLSSGSTGFGDLKMLSISRLLLDNIPHIKVHWSATDLKFAQAALSFGADDIGGTNLSERVMHEAGSTAPADLSSGDLVRLIKDAGYEPVFVNSSYSNSNPDKTQS